MTLIRNREIGEAGNRDIGKQGLPRIDARIKNESRSGGGKQRVFENLKSSGDGLEDVAVEIGGSDGLRRIRCGPRDSAAPRLRGKNRETTRIFAGFTRFERIKRMIGANDNLN